MAENKFVNFLKKYVWDIVAIALAILLFVADLVSKLCILDYFVVKGNSQPIVLIQDFLQISYVRNPKFAFGFGFAKNPEINRIFSIVFGSSTLLGIVGFYVYNIIKKKPLKPIYKICMFLIASGAIGNVVDRLAYGSEYGETTKYQVVDWIDFNGIWQFVFNIADACVVVACLTLAVVLIVEEVKDYLEKRKQKQANTENVEEEKVLSVEEKKRLEEAAIDVEVSDKTEE